MTRDEQLTKVNLVVLNAVCQLMHSEALHSEVPGHASSEILEITIYQPNMILTNLAD